MVKTIEECPVDFNIIQGNFIWHFSKLKSKEKGVSLHRLEQALYGHHVFPIEIANATGSPTETINRHRVL